MNLTKPIELLAPARDAEAAITAINFGADAVYIGAPRFGARAEAGNSIQDIERATRYAHLYHARVYAAINTILFDHELEEARKIITGLIHAGIDALIIQDMGILRMGIPPVELHASTQTHNADPEKVRWLESAGFSRVILARELTLEQIREIRSLSTVELEAFVHGALCVSMSGQCYMSLASGERSGNRGVCAQPCRKLYDLKDASGNVILSHKHLLSLKDLDLSGYLTEMAAAGISSFKIEGRLKDLNYLKNITAYYRKKIDAFLDGNPEYRKSSSGKVWFDFDPDPVKTFSRGTSHYFITGRQTDITSFETPKSAGEPVGTAINSSGNRLIIDRLMPLSNNDGITWYSEGRLNGAKVNVADGNRLLLAESAEITPGTSLFRNYNHAFSEKLKASRTQRKIELKVELRFIPDGLVLKGTDENGIMLEKKFIIEKQISRQPEKAGDIIREQLSKSGDTPFEITDVKITWDQPFFMPVSKTNAIRREFLEAFCEERRRKRAVPSVKKEDKDFRWPVAAVSYLGNVSNHLAEKFYRDHGAEKIEPALEVSRDYAGRRLMTMKHCLKYHLGYCPREKNSRKMQWKEPLFLVDGRKRFRLEFDCTECRMNLYHP